VFLNNSGAQQGTVILPEDGLLRPKHVGVPVNFYVI